MARIELLAPAGNEENFLAAMDAGADAVYVGAPGFNARNLARELRLEEIAAMISYCRRRGKKLYIAANSLVLERELPAVINSLALLEELEPDGLIVQDPGIVHLVSHYFPDLALHASTLMTAHNSDSVNFLFQLGFRRVVLARELTLKEIATIGERCPGMELEVFVHGAMCFSYSGLCLFSSYLGGKSGLRGRCVQPCRRSYTISSSRGSAKSGKGGYLFSMNDLAGFEALEPLKKAGVVSFKIEGRLRSARYVDHIVRAYRLVLDAGPVDMEKALTEAVRLAREAMSRKTSSGYFFSPQPAGAITPFHSGNMGTHLGRFSTIKKAGDESICRFVLKSALAAGDRVRLHFEPSGERIAFRLKKLFVAGEEKKEAKAGERVSLAVPEKVAERFINRHGRILRPGHKNPMKVPTAAVQSSAADFQIKHVDVYRVDGGVTKRLGAGLDPVKAAENLAYISGRIKGNVTVISRESCAPEGGKQVQSGQRRFSAGRSAGQVPLEWWLKTDSIKSVQYRLPFSPDRLLLCFEKSLISQAGMVKRYLGRGAKKVIWALPPLVMENDLARVKKQIRLLVRSGFRSFQLGHSSQLSLFKNEKVRLFADYTLNLMNNRALFFAEEIGFDGVQLAIEMDKSSLSEAVAGYRELRKREWLGEKNVHLSLGLTVYGAPALYTSRLTVKQSQAEKPLVSPRKEPFVIRKKEGFSQTFPQKPFSLLPWLGELKELGLDYVVVDTCGGRFNKKEQQELKERLAGSGRYSRLSTFNYFGRLD
ncbi:peptidase U32 family protein [Desulfomarina sp.]